jgi:hypothetical protein
MFIAGKRRSGHASWLRDSAETPGADVDPLRLSVYLDGCSLNVRLEHPIGLVVRVADLVAEARSLATDVTFTGHTGPLCVSVSVHLRLRTRLVHRGISRARNDQE